MTLQQPGGRKLLSAVGNYKFTGRRLGKGNFAKVEEAAHTLLNVKVAIKIMDVSTIKEEYVVRNLYREAKIMSRLSHPCIAALFQTMQHGNIYYLVTELVGGGDLCNFIKAHRNGRLEEHCSRVFARQLISAIAYMHNLGIVHRDLKMENIMLNNHNDRVKIVDFGLSNIYSSENPLRTHCGSPEYAAPELFVEGKHYGPEVDIWSLGVILYGMVIGQLPFMGTTREGAAVSQQQRRKKLLEQINKGLAAPHRRILALFSTEFKAMMARLLVADSSKRHNISELVFHPWVTEKGRKAVRTRSMRKIDAATLSNIFKEIAELVQMEVGVVEHTIKADPHGNLAGIYNLIVHKSSVTFSETEKLVKSPIYLTPRSERATELHVVRTRKSAPLTKTTTPRPKSEKKPLVAKEHGINFTPLRRKEVEVDSAGNLKRRNSYKNCISPGGDTNNTKFSMMFYKMSAKQSPQEEKAVQIFLKPQTRKIQSANIHVDNPKVKVIPNNVQQQRPTTGPVHTAERASKRRSMLPVMTNKSLSVNRSVTATTRGAPISEKYDRRNSVKLDFSNDPIARSIAGYVTKNIANKLEKVSKLKTKKP